MHLRDAGPLDGEALTDALLSAANWDDQERVTREQLLADPELSHYVTGWPRPTDFGTVAVADDDSAVIGAAWCRVFDAVDPGYGYVSDGIPELSIGLRPACRGRGIGSALLDAVIAQAAARHHQGVSLSVEDDNRARALYVRAGSIPVGRTGGSDTLLLHL
ncbi:GNAT family N-acetyltransferase [Arthrobacter castelli]|uniref:GNAT family N-acetyltransferase n=1 Tax=Arthrobacter castelli TaxID=271431 RepID=UPI00047C1AE0|nr:GNAT family N-acetyltransferase [Arthrobacter castelli]